MFDKVLVPMALDHGISSQTLEIARAITSETGTVTALHVGGAEGSSLISAKTPSSVGLNVRAPF